MRRLITALAIGFGLLGPTIASKAQDYPTHPIRLIVPFAPGGGSDLLARIAADGLTPHLGQNVVVENKPGGGATIGADTVAKSKPDGYTLLLSAADSASLAGALKPALPYKVPDDFNFVAQIAEFPFIICVNPKLPINTLAEFIAYGKANPGKLRYGTGGIGTAPHMSSLLIGKAAGIDLLHIPYGGNGPAVTAAVGGFVDFVVFPPSIKSFVDAGSLRAIASTGIKRHPDFPNLPILSEGGLTGLSIINWYGILAPAGTPEPIIAKLRKATADMMKDPKTEERLNKIQLQSRYLDAPEFREVVVKDLERWKEVAKAANISLQQ